MAPYPGFVGASYVATSPIANNERTVNWYVERQEVAHGKSRDVLYPAPGLISVGASLATPGRAHAVADGREFAVIGNKFGEIALSGTFTELGTVAIDEFPATISHSSAGELFITSGNNGYLLVLSTNVFSTVRSGATRMGAFLDGWFLALDAATGTVFQSGLLNGATWDPNDFFQRSDQPDGVVSLQVWDQYVWLMGPNTSSVWYNAGTSPIAFQPHPSGRVPFGVAAPFSPRVVAGALTWVSGTGSGRGAVVRAAGFTPEVVSTFPLQSAFEGYDDLAQAVGDTYEALGHMFYLLTFPLSGSWAYDATTTLQLPHAMRWTERLTWISEENRYIASRALFHAYAFNQHRMLDRETGSIYRLTTDSAVDAGDRPMRRLRRAPALQAREGRLFVPEFELCLETGLGLVSGQGSDPQVSLKVSTDGGKTWGNERFRRAGAMGEYDTRVNWTRCGSVPHGGAFQPEVVVTDPIPWRITGALLPAPGR